MSLNLADRVVASMPWLDPLADRLQNAVHEAVLSGGPNAATAKDALHGRWLGHPLHPALVSVPLGAWTATLILDLTGMERGADISLALGIAGATGAALTGAADWSETDGENRRLGLVHALLNTASLATNVISLGMRLSGRRSRAVALSTASLLLANVSAFLGGELAYVKGVGVDHSAWDSAPEDFTPVLEAGTLQEGKPVRCEIDGTAVVIVKQGPQIFALNATCTHAGGPLDEGKLEGDAIVCPWHGSAFCLRDGSVRRGPASIPAKRFEVRLSDGKVEVRKAT